MSLIVARKLGRKFVVVSDTKLTYECIDSSRPSKGVVKTTIIDPQVLVSFAGDISYAELAFQDLGGGQADYDDIKLILDHYHKKSEYNTEFILAYGKPHFCLVEFKNGICKEVNNSWVGSKAAFAKFQSFYHDKNQPLHANTELTQFIARRLPDDFVTNTERNIYNRLIESMNAAIEEPSIPEVDGFVIPAAYEKGRFAYMSYCHVYRNAMEPGSDEANGLRPMSFGEASQGAYCVNFSGTASAKIAVHVYQGNIGIVHLREDKGLMYPKVYENHDEIDFTDLLKEKYGMTIGHIQYLLPHFGRKAQGLMKSGNYLDALHYFQRGIAEQSRYWTDSANNQKFESVIAFTKKYGYPKFKNSDKKDLANTYYYRAVCYLHLNNIVSAINEIKEVMAVDRHHVKTLKLIEELENNNLKVS